MLFKYGPPAIACFLLTACAEPPAPVSEAQQFIDGVADALGGKEKLAAARTLTVKAEGRMRTLGQDLAPEAMTREFNVSAYELTLDLADGSSRVNQTRRPLFNYFLGQGPVQQILGLDDSVAYNIAADGSAQRLPEYFALERQSTYYHHPLPLLQAALLGTATTSNLRDEKGLELVDIKTAGGKQFTVAIDPATKLPATIQSTDYHPVLRDVTRSTSFSDYQAVGGLMLPASITQNVDEFTVTKLQVRSQTVNTPIDNIGAPPEVAAAAPITGDSPVQISVDEIDDGVWLLANQGYNSVLVEFADHLMLVEAPNEPHTLAALAKARELVPDKPVTQLVNSHYHFDHSAGIRTAVAKGLTILTHAANEAFYRRMARQPSTITPDELSSNPKDIKIETFEETATYEDESMTVELYHLKGSPHTDSLVMAYLPKQRLVIQADAFTPGSKAPQWSAPNLLENIEQYELKIDRVVALHGGVIELETLQAAVEALQD
jgi:glyoxylase-like metal-dependent hydrolase (beta-lactamase superfamily II)